MEHDSQPEAYYVHVWIRGIHPMLWRRFLVRSDSALADLHAVLQVGFDWTDFHQMRTKVLNDQLRESFVRWYPEMQTEQEAEIQKKAT